MDGTETGWSRPGEPAPRWRALLDRARLGRGGEQDEGGGRDGGGRWLGGGRSAGAPGEAPAAPGQPGGAGQPGQPTGIGYPADLGQLGEPSAYPAEPGVSRFALLENGYRAPRYVPPVPPQPQPQPPALPRRALPPSAPTERGYAGPADGYSQPAGRAYTAPVEPRYTPPAEPGYVSPAETRYAEPGYAAPTESRYAALESSGYRAEPSQPPQPQPQPQPRSAAREMIYPRRLLERREARRDSEVDRAVSVLRRDLGSPRVLAFANPKGGVHKTTATVLAAATIGSVRGRGVLAWDDNELRGTLGLRAGSARHARTIRHLIADLIEVEARHGAELTERLDDYLRHASDGSYDVLAGEESPRFAQQLDQHTVRRVLDLLRRTHDVICVDTGNNVESVNWQTVLGAADQLVLTTVPREDAAFTADWMLDLLHEVGMGELAANAVTLLSCPTPGRSPLQDDLEKHFATRTRAVAVVPYDPALEVGSSIEYGQLQQSTRDAWLRAASVMLEPFVR